MSELWQQSELKSSASNNPKSDSGQILVQECLSVCLANVSVFLNCGLSVKHNLLYCTCSLVDIFYNANLLVVLVKQQHHHHKKKGVGGVACNL